MPRLRRALRRLPGAPGRAALAGLYAACITATALLAGTWPTLPQLLWWPDAMHTCLDAPAWSLFVEAAVTPALPLIFRLVRYPLPCIVCLVPALALPGSWPVWVLEFVAGAALAQVPIRWPPRVPRPLALLGRVSYPLYLCHWPCIAVGVAAFGLTWGPFASLPLIAVVTWGLYRWVEIPSITASPGRWGACGGRNGVRHLTDPIMAELRRVAGSRLCRTSGGRIAAMVQPTSEWRPRPFPHHAAKVALRKAFGVAGT